MIDFGEVVWFILFSQEKETIAIGEDCNRVLAIYQGHNAGLQWQSSNQGQNGCKRASKGHLVAVFSGNLP